MHVHYHPEQLVFANESHFNQLTLRRPYAWLRCGEHASQHEFQFWGTKYTILLALSLDGILHLEVVENAVTSDIFWHFLEGLLPHMNKWPLLNSVLVIDNASIHKVTGIHKLVEEHGMCLIFLPFIPPILTPLNYPSQASRCGCARIMIAWTGRCSPRMAWCITHYGRQCI